jgi:Arc/MetJ family transcription regulator
MASQKRSISFDESVLAEAERLAGLRGGNLSALVNAAVERELRVTRGLELLEADEAELGPVPDAVKADIAAEWPA